MRIAVSGDGYFLTRYTPLLQALGAYADSVEAVPGGNLSEWLPMRVYNRLTRGTSLHGRLLAPDPNPTAFAIRSRRAERRLASLQPTPDLVLHIFCSFAPVWSRPLACPYAFYVDYTMAQAIREYPEWARLRTPAAQEAWLRFERATYARASHIFTMTEAGAAALNADYGVHGDRLTVVGNGGHIATLYDGPKTFGTHHLLFDGSDMHRKGGDILLAALAQVRQTLPSATLTVVGNTDPIVQDGVRSLGPGHSTAKMRELFLASDLVVTPARCDPFPGLVVEAMNYGVPIVTSRVSGSSGAVTRHQCGVVVDELSGDAFAPAIHDLLLDQPRLEQMSANGRRAVRERFNWTAIAATMASALGLRHASAPAR